MEAEEVRRNLRAINTKLDRVIDLLEANMDTPEEKKIKTQIMQQMNDSFLAGSTGNE